MVEKSLGGRHFKAVVHERVNGVQILVDCDENQKSKFR
jgi:hypothetical protein